MPKSRSILPALLLLPVAAAACLGIAFGANYLLSLPQRAEQAFGPAAAGLSPLGRLRLSYRLLQDQETLTTTTDASGAPQIFTIGLGESTGAVLNRLTSEGLIDDVEAMRNAGLDTRLQAGQHQLSAAMSPVEIAQALQDATPLTVKFNVLAGWRLEEIAASLLTSGLDFSPEEFLEAARRHSGSYDFVRDLPYGVSLEGYLLPGGYEIQRDASVEEFITTLLDRFDSLVTEEIRQGFERQGLSLHEGVTLASIVQREAVVPEEQPLIASVFLNRLAIGMRLDADPTVQYAAGFNAAQGTWWTNPLSSADLEIDSPYNTYRYAGLPPGPIANPGLGALQATAFPAQTPYYYFRAACDGSGRHSFAETLEEQQANACP